MNQTNVAFCGRVYILQGSLADQTRDVDENVISILHCETAKAAPR